MSQQEVLEFLKQHEGVYYSRDNLVKLTGLSKSVIQQNVKRLIISGDVEFDYFVVGENKRKKQRIRYVKKEQGD